MNITKTELNINFHTSKLISPRFYSSYTLHEIDVFNNIMIDGVEHQAVYQTGNSFDHNDYDCPSPEITLSDDCCGAGTSRLIWKIWSAGEKEIEELSDDDLTEFCESLTKTEDFTLFTKAELLEIYAAIVENNLNAVIYFENLELPDAEGDEE